MISNKMKKILIVTVAVATLSGCSSFHSFMDNLYSSDDAISINPDDTLDNPDQDGEAISVENPTSSLKLKYVKKTNEIDAQIITNWNDAPQGSVYLTWTAPKKASCYSTSFPITKYKDDQDYTKDSQSVVSKETVCEGKWIATVVNKSDNSELAKESIIIK